MPDPTPEFSVLSQRTGGTLVLELAGELDLDGTSELDRALHAAMASDAERIVLDLEQLRFIGSSGLACLVRAQQLSNEDGNRLRVRGAEGQVRRLLELTCIEQHLVAG